MLILWGKQSKYWSDYSLCIKLQLIIPPYEQIHSKTKEPKKLCVQADIIVAACGKAKFIDDTWIKDNAIVIDVGIHRLKNGLCGDVDFEKVIKKTDFLTPVPGGVGPMTIAYLLKNSLKAYEINTK